jgi:hypothetical protein
MQNKCELHVLTEVANASKGEFLFVHVCEIHLKFYTDCFANNSISESEMDSSEERQFSSHSWK